MFPFSLFLKQTDNKISKIFTKNICVVVDYADTRFSNIEFEYCTNEIDPVLACL